MSYIARRAFKKTWERVGKEDQARIEKLTLPRGVSFRTYRYIENGDPLHTLSIYWPESKRDEELPVIIDIHGGGWMYGSKEVNRPFDLALASLGFSVVGLSYRYCPQTDMKGILQDIFAAVNFAYSKRVELGLDFTRAFLTGDSAGGQLVGLVAGMQMVPYLLNYVGVKAFPFRIKAVNFNHAVPYIAQSGFHSAGKLMNKIGNRELMRELFGGVFKKDREFTRLGSDIDELLKEVPSFPPSLVTTSTGDRSFCWQSEKLYESLKAKGVDCELFEVPDERHVYNVINMDKPTGIKANKRIADFFRKHQGGDRI